jgi:hypothetical protein
MAITPTDTTPIRTTIVHKKTDRARFIQSSIVSELRVQVQSKCERWDAPKRFSPALSSFSAPFN